MLVRCRVTLSIKFAKSHYFIHLCGEVSFPRAQRNDPGQGSNLQHSIRRYAAKSTKSTRHLTYYYCCMVVNIGSYHCKQVMVPLPLPSKAFLEVDFHCCINLHPSVGMNFQWLLTCVKQNGADVWTASIGIKSPIWFKFISRGKLYFTIFFYFVLFQPFK